MRTLHRKLFRELQRHAVQMLSIALVMACGVMAIMGLRSTETSIRVARDDYFARHRLADVFASAHRAPAAVAARIAAIPGVLVAETRIVREVKVDVPGLAEPAAARVVSVPDAGRPALNGVVVRNGRWLAPHSIDEALVSERFAELNGLEPGDSLGVVVNGHWQRVHIRGIASSPEYVIEFAHGLWVDNRRYGILWMNASALERAFDMSGAFNDVTLKLDPNAVDARVIDALDDVLRPWGGAGAYARADQPAVRVLEDEFTQLRTNATIFPVFFLVVAAFLLNVVLSRLVASQREEIAALKAFGYTDREIGAHYVGFAVAAVVVGSALGLPAGIWMGARFTDMYATYFRFPNLHPVVDWQSATLAIGVSGAFAMLGAVGGVRRVMRLAPAEALRPESPGSVRPLLLEALGFGARLPSAVRMALRNLERRPVRTGATVIGIGLAVALLVAGRFPYDAVSRLIDVEFQRSQRYSAAVAFNGPQSVSSATVLRQIDGVLAVEPFRATAIRIRRNGAARTVTLTGLEPHGTLFRLANTNGAVFSPPRAGLALTASLAHVLGLRAGDTVDLELLERASATRAVVVAGTFDPMVGQGAFTSLATLDALMGAVARSGAYVAIAPGADARVFGRLKEVPGVAGVTSRAATVRNIEHQMREGMRLSLIIIVTSAVMIAAGVVYNSARIALSERGRELATLRVLGFSANEVGAMLFGEQAAVLTVAIPIGIGLGGLFSYALVRGFENERFHFPFVISGDTLMFATMVVVAATIVTAFAVRRRIGRLDLVGALRARE